MNLDAQQLMEALIAVQSGLSCASWEGVTDRPWWELSTAEQEAVLVAVRTFQEKQIREMGLDPGGLNQQFLDRMNLAAIEQEEREWRKMWQDAPQAPPGEKPRKVSASGLRMALNDLLSQEPFAALTVVQRPPRAALRACAGCRPE